jgi:DNA polymerase III delta prime subunit
MDKLNINQLLNRNESSLKIKEFLTKFEIEKHNLIFTKGIYIYGEPGTGKTTFIMNLLKEMNYDVVKYDAGDVRNKSIIETITKHNMSDTNIMSMFHKKIQKIAIVMDEIDGMNNGDKGGINTLIKLIRPKKTKKQKKEEVTINPIICIGNYHIDKKIKELMKVCFVVELEKPNIIQMTNIVNNLMPNIHKCVIDNIIKYIQFDLRKLNALYNIYKNDNDFFKNNHIEKVFQIKSYNDDTKKITKKLINNHYKMNEHLTIMNETDRTIVGLLWHENIIDLLIKIDKNISIPFYIKLLNNMCFADYIDRITFQKQIWQFNEMSSLIKTFNNNKLYHENFKKIKYNPTEVRFTKVLTKYSTEYNNSLFIQNLCQQLGMDKKDIFSFFLDLRNKYDDVQITEFLENYEITKLDINRIYRYIEKYTKENAEDFPDDAIIEDEIINDSEF